MDEIARGLLPEGLRDRLPPEAEAAAALLHGLLETVASHGYERVQPPLIEFEESLAGRVGSGSERHLFRFVDPVSSRTLALRHDMTGQVGRIAATRLVAQARPLRLAYGGPVLRVKGSQLFPERESCQAGAELIGSDGVAAAREVLRLAVEALTAAGLGGLTVDLTLPGLVPALADGPWPVEDLAAVRAMLDGKDFAGLRAAGGGAYEPLIAAAGPIDAALAAVRSLPGPGKALADDVARVIDGLEGVSLTLDPTELHGFEFQSWLGFSIFADGVRGEVGRGGTYTIAHPGGAREAAVGFSLYVDGLVDAGFGRSERRRVLLPAGTAAGVGGTLRAAGWTTVAALGDETAATLRCSHIWNGVEARPA